LKRQLFDEIEHRRDNIQILADILKVTSQPTKMTKILRVANIPYDAFQKCIDKLNDAGLIRVIPIEKGSGSSHDKRTSYVFEATIIGINWCKKVENVYNTLEMNSSS